MIKPRNIESLTNFQKRSKEIIAQLEASGEPMVLTVNGKAKLVIQDASAYEANAFPFDAKAAREAVLEALKQVDSGKTIPLADVAAEMKSKYEL